MGLKPLLARVAYGAVFTLAAPALLAWWAWTTRATVRLPVPDTPLAGWSAVSAGALLMALGMRGLWRDGGGLPMNAFPPPRLVARGIFALLPHPIYLGFVLACAGASLVAGSASGLWLVTPCTALALWALVAGFERKDLLRRFGALHRPLIALPPDEDAPPGAGRRLGTALLVFAPWLLLYDAVHRLGRPPDAFALELPGEAAWPVLVQAEWIYASAYLVPLAVLVPRTARELRRFAIQGLLATGSLTLLYLVLPVYAPFRPFSDASLAGRLLAQERTWSIAAVAAFPSFHVVWTVLAAAAVQRRSRRAGALAWAWSLAVAAGCSLTGMHTVADIVAGLAAGALFARHDRVWEALRHGAERIANARREWRLGPVRVISHGLYAGLGAATGVWLIAALGGRDLWAVPLVGACGVVGAALWAQLVEGSPALLRPFGYYGSLAGCLVALPLAALLGADALLLLGAFAAAAPFIQAWGRLRCLVQGCCHGHATAPWLGIRVHDARSRVVKLAGLGGVPLHPTQLYSALGNLAIGLLLVRLWFLAAPPTLIAGLYLVLSGIARFAEEAWRGEPQTLRRAGLPIYQWLAVLAVLGGIALTTWPAAPAPRPLLGGWPELLIALGFGAATWFAMGVDFPASSRRFARLT